MFQNLPRLSSINLPDRASGLSFCTGDRVRKPGLFLSDLTGKVVRVLSRSRRLYRVKWDTLKGVETVPGDHLQRG